MVALLALNPDDRPRERMAAQGPANVTDIELLAVLIGSGTEGRSTLDVAAELLAAVGGIEGLVTAAPSQLLQQRGIGPARVGLIQAALELGRRAVGERPRRGCRFSSASDVWTHLRARMVSAPVEEFWSLGLDVRHRVQSERCVARGSLTGVEVHPRDVFRRLIQDGAAAVIFCHNHPSGDPSPSRQDIELTARLREVGDLCGITVLDHVIVGWEGYVSLAERQWT